MNFIKIMPTPLMINKNINWVPISPFSLSHDNGNMVNPLICTHCILGLWNLCRCTKYLHLGNVWLIGYNMEYDKGWDILSTYLYIYIYIYIYPFHMGYVNPMIRYEIYISHVSKIYFLSFFISFNIRILQNIFYIIN